MPKVIPSILGIFKWTIFWIKVWIKLKTHPKNDKNSPQKIQKEIMGKVLSTMGDFFVFLALFLFYLGDLCIIWGIYVLFGVIFVFFGGKKVGEFLYFFGPFLI